MERRVVVLLSLSASAIAIWMLYSFRFIRGKDSVGAVDDFILPRPVDERIRAIEKELLLVKMKVENESNLMELGEYSERAENGRTKIVLVFTDFFGQKPWGWMKDTRAFNKWNGIQCPYFRCRLTYSRRDFLRADAVIFHAKDMPGKWAMNNLLHHKPRAQKWIYFAKENPMNNESPKRLNNMFHWTLTYSRNSEFFFPYGFYYSVNNPQGKKPDISYVKGKDKLVVWTSSHCNLPRENYVRKLLKFIKVDVFGTCAKYVRVPEPGNCTKNSLNCKTSLRRYKFQLAFENTNCVDYITEKYWEALKLGIIPIVLGGSLYASDVAIPGSFINVMDFPTVKALADYILYLDKNDEAYSKYFTWKSKYKVVNYSPWNCGLCAALNMNKKETYIARLDEFWSATKYCGVTDSAVNRIINNK